MRETQFEQPFGKTLNAGDAWSWNVSLADFDSSLYTLKISFRGGGQKLDITATPNGVGFDYVLYAAPSATKVWTAKSEVSWSAYVTLNADGTDAFGNPGHAGDKTELARGTVVILPEISAQANDYDGRTWARRSLDAIEAVIEGRASRADLEYQIGSRHLRSMSHAELLAARGEFRAMVNRELTEAGQLSPQHNLLQVAFK